ncbi:MAG: SWIM zinc finger family protein [Candidatus Sulfotelmatobacter sp.]
MELAATHTIQQKAGIWIVPSQTGKGTYRVHLMPKIASCTCPDFETRGVNCKHLYAARFVMRREQNADGSVIVTESVTLTAAKRTAYPQAWSAYNEAQTNEQDKFQSLLHDLCSGLVSTPAKNGRPRLPLADAVFHVTFKVYSTVSQRRFMSDRREAHRRGYISKVPHFNSIPNYLERPELTANLQRLHHADQLATQGCGV